MSRSVSLRWASAHWLRAGLALAIFCVLAGVSGAREPDFGRELKLPEVGETKLRILSPTVLELGLITEKKEGKPLEQWNFDERGSLALPPAENFVVEADGKRIPVVDVGFRRRPVYAPEGRWDLRVGNWIYLRLAASIPEGASVRVKDQQSDLWKDVNAFTGTLSQSRIGAAIHTNQVAYETGYSKQAVIGYYLGTMGELEVDPGIGFYLKNTKSEEIVHKGSLQLKRDHGLPWQQYQRTLLADFSDFNEPGTYRLGVKGHGESFPFRIGRGMFATLARTYALGMYHQRSGEALVAPYTGYTRGGSHMNSPRVATVDDQKANEFIEKMSEGEMQGVAGSRFPAVNQGRIPAVGGHHDAGDYSKYTSNSALLINALVFAVDILPGVDKIDNLGLPESGDGIPDLLQLAKWEADFLANMQDKDGGFFFLVYPENRKYESGPPDPGDPQVLFPKNTAVTGSGIAALAQIASSPGFKKHYPKDSERYLDQAERGWVFLEKAWEKYGLFGAYQRISHYGHRFKSKDEVVWAATELFLATGKEKYGDFVKQHFDPADNDTRLWGWLRLVEGYGAAARSYATAVESGRVSVDVLDRYTLNASKRELLARADDLVKWADACAYGTSLSLDSKRWGNAGWHFASELAFDLAVARAIGGRQDAYLEALMSNVHYELGVNPVGQCFVTGLGWRRQHEIVYQWAQATPNSLPMTGIPLGSVQQGFGYIHPYKKELGQLSIPRDGDKRAPYAFFDRWADTFNTSTEFVTFSLGRCLAMSAMMMAETGFANQEWQPISIRIEGVPNSVKVGEIFQVSLAGGDGRDLGEAVIVWEAGGVSPYIGTKYELQASKSGPGWIMVEVQWPDGVRAFARKEFVATSAIAALPLPVTPRTKVNLNGDSETPGNVLKGDLEAGSGVTTTVQGQPRFSQENLAWMKSKSGNAIKLNGVGDSLRFEFDQVPSGVFSAWVFVEKFPYGQATCDLLSLRSIATGEPEISLHMDKWKKPGFPDLRVGGNVVLERESTSELIKLGDWQFWQVRFSGDQVSLKINGVVIPLAAAKNSGRGISRLEIGNFTGLIDEIRIDELREGEKW